MKTSAAGINFIKLFEGYSATPYKDTAGKPTIGYGHLIKPGEVFGAVSNSQATALLAADLESAEDAVTRLVKVTLTQTQFDACVSWVYNLGETNFKTSTLLADINQGADNIGIYPQFLRWCNQTVDGKLQKVMGLYYRRLAEATLFKTGDYTAAMAAYSKR
jgi:lysozyme